jgi:hypothetical protein
VDYEIDYQGGRIMFKKPVPSRVNASFLLGAADTLSALLTLDGHEVRIVVDYQTRTAGDVRDTSFGLRGSQQIAKMVTVRGGYIQEGRASGQGSGYQIHGAGIKITPTKTTVIDGEWAESKSNNGAHALSYDGGLSFQKIGTPLGESDSGEGISISA